MAPSLLIRLLFAQQYFPENNFPLCPRLWCVLRFLYQLLVGVIFLFSKIEDAAISTQLEKYEQTKNENEIQAKPLPEKKATISFEDFKKLDLRVGTVLEAEKVKKTKKLLQLKVDIGTEVRTIVSGIAESYSPESIVGQKVTVLTNLAPRKIKGVESQGMLLMSEDKTGKHAIVAPTEDEVNNGFPIA